MRSAQARGNKCMHCILQCLGTDLFIIIACIASRVNVLFHPLLGRLTLVIFVLCCFNFVVGGYLNESLPAVIIIAFNFN